MKTPFDNYPTRSIPTASFGSESYLDLLLLLTTCCNKGTERDGNVASGRPMITVWAHQGKPEEWKTIQSQFERFNASQTNVSARLVEIPQANYDTQVQSAAASSQLPDVLEFDGPLLANYAWKGYLKPLEGLPTEVRSDLLPSIVQQGTYGGKFYAVGTFDSGLGLFANRRLLEQVSARIPTNVPSAWTIDEFNQLLGRLAEQEKRSGGDWAGARLEARLSRRVVDLRLLRQPRQRRCGLD